MSAINRNYLKLIAILTMLIDHAGIFLFHENVVCRSIGRLAFPLFVYLLADGYFRSHNKEKYSLRLLCFWIITIPAYWFAFSGTYYIRYQNIFLELFVMSILFAVLDMDISPWLKGFCAFVFACVGNQIGFEYGWYGIALSVVMFTFVKEKDYLDMCLHFMILVLLNTILLHYPAYSMLAVLTVFLLPPNGELAAGSKPSKFTSWMSYLFYPVHLIFLRVITL